MKFPRYIKIYVCLFSNHTSKNFDYKKGKEDTSCKYIVIIFFCLVFYIENFTYVVIYGLHKQYLSLFGITLKTHCINNLTVRFRSDYFCVCVCSCLSSPDTRISAWHIYTSFESIFICTYLLIIS